MFLKILKTNKPTMSPFSTESSVMGSSWFLFCPSSLIPAVPPAALALQVSVCPSNTPSTLSPPDLTLIVPFAGKLSPNTPSWLVPLSFRDFYSEVRSSGGLLGSSCIKERTGLAYLVPTPVLLLSIVLNIICLSIYSVFPYLSLSE